MTCKLITMDWWPETFSIQGIVLFYLQDFFPHQRKKKGPFSVDTCQTCLFPRKALRYNNEQSSMTEIGKNLEGCGALGAETKMKMITAACARKHGTFFFFKQSLAVSFSVRIIQLLQNLYFDISSLKGAVLSISKLFCVHIRTHSCMMHLITEERGREGGNKKQNTKMSEGSSNIFVQGSVTSWSRHV